MTILWNVTFIERSTSFSFFLIASSCVCPCPGLFGKAKKKILSLDESPDGSSSSGSVYNKKYTVDYYEQYWPLQELGKYLKGKNPSKNDYENSLLRLSKSSSFSHTMSITGIVFRISGLWGIVIQRSSIGIVWNLCTHQTHI